MSAMHSSPWGAVLLILATALIVRQPGIPA